MNNLLIPLIMAYIFVGCGKPQWRINEDKAFAKADILIITSEGRYSKTYFSLSDSIKFNSTNTCISFSDLLSNSQATTCGSFTIKGK